MVIKRIFQAMVRITTVVFLIEAGMYLGLHLSKRVIHPMLYQSIDPRFSTYVDDFIKEAADHGVKVDTDRLGLLGVGNLDFGLGGLCQRSAKPVHYGASLWISQDYVFRNLTGYSMKRLLFHELGHCLLDKDHDPDGYDTIMSSQPLHLGADDEVEFQKHEKSTRENWDRLTKDLFTRQGPPPESARIK